MYKQLTALALCTAAACFAANAHAQIQDVTGWFINGGVGSAHYSASYEGTSLGSASDTGFQFNGGWRSQFIGFEAGYTDLGKVTGHYADADLGSADARLSGRGWTAGLNGHFNPTNKWYISGRAGFFFWTVKARANLADTAGNSVRLTGSEHGMNGYAGVGTGIDFNRHWSLGVNFDYYKINKDHFNVGTKLYSVTAEYRF